MNFLAQRMMVFIRRKLFENTTPKHISELDRFSLRILFLHSQSFRSFQKDSTNVHSKNKWFIVCVWFSQKLHNGEDLYPILNKNSFVDIFLWRNLNWKFLIVLSIDDL